MGKHRDGFKSRTGFVLACIGSAVGMGNIWRFPYMVSEWGGMTFLLPYVLFVILIASTGVIEEMALGRAAKSGPIKAFGKCTEIRTGNKRTGEVIGVIPVIGSLALAIGYSVVVGWIFKYTFFALSGGLFHLGQDVAAIEGLFGGTAAAFGNNVWQVVAMLVTAVIMAYGISGGIEKANKIMMPMLFILFVGLGIYIFTLPGSEHGYRYIFTLDPKGLFDPRLWIYAFGQAFFSLSIAGNGTVIYGSYLSEEEDVVRSARNVAFFDTLAALLAALVIIPGMAVGGAELSSEAPVEMMQERFGFRRKIAVAVIAMLGGIISLMIQGIVSGWMDAVSIYICPLGAMLAAIMFFWVAGKDFALTAVNKGTKKPIGSWFMPLGKYVLVPAALLALVAGALLGGIG